MSISKSNIKRIRLLEQKKHRKEEGVFLAEGPKLITDLSGTFRCRFLAATAEWLQQNPHIPADEITEVSVEELSRCSLLTTPQQVLAIFEQPRYQLHSNIVRKSLSLALDDVQDPGNLGTIIRIADWFGIEHVFCSSGTVDIYNPKVVQATMGAIARVKVHYVLLPELIRSLGNIPVYGTFLDGENIYTQSLSTNGVIVMGNEGKGIGKDTETFINRRLFIPSYPPERETSESLNVAVATAIVCAEFRRISSSPE
ncbi:23S rRNA (guanosine-2'-O-)-methyltransferase RlmB [termite gut metagenome]|uniref:23S rRNA (Guanosine-2'-O-)-methyltransferase RlmB n=1 Tax=termite gut metagenome TaxID=433724 RepID=A0A5J4QX61_9ZZZZ